jgi:hypothetical protein
VVPWDDDLSLASVSQRKQLSLRWRLVSGHDTGQVVYWELGSRSLTPLGMIKADSSPVRGLAGLEEHHMLLIVHASGWISILPWPSPRSCSQRSSSASQMPLNWNLPQVKAYTWPEM